MTPEFIAQMREEESALKRRLRVVEAWLAEYDAKPFVPRPSPAAASIAAARVRLPLERFSPYGATIIRQAMEVARTRGGEPVPTREMVIEIENAGLIVNGVDKANALSALLARSADMVNHGRRGWTLAPEAETEVSAEEDATMIG